MRAVLIHQGYATMLDRENKPTVSMRWGGTWDYREGAKFNFIELDWWGIVRGCWWNECCGIIGEMGKQVSKEIPSHIVFFFCIVDEMLDYCFLFFVLNLSGWVLSVIF